jgi:hypothetical protein
VIELLEGEEGLPVFVVAMIDRDQRRIIIDGAP